ncbi:MAG: SfiI family type II restriction endonuclease [Candidatus Brocadia sp.]|nr:SfiI family type II restriction endonuclease [Candidatus Brocadia sp.]
MKHLRDPNNLTPDEIEAIEKQSLRSLYTAAFDFGFDAFDIFNQSSDDPKDIAEDITREMLDRLGGYQVQQRILGNVDYRKAGYIILPDFSIRQALFVDSKAEKSSSSAIMQMSQLALAIRQIRNGEEIEQDGDLPYISVHGGQPFITTTLLSHYHYEDQHNKYKLKQLTLAAIPNGILQDRYNPDAHDTIWIAGRNAPSRGEEFRVRLSFHRLKLKSAWRVQTIAFNPEEKTILSNWDG